MTAADAVEKITETFEVNASEFRGEHTINVAGDAILDVMTKCKEIGFDYLVDISSLDHMEEEPRFEMVYELYSYAHGCHLRVKAPVNDETLEVPSVIDIWSTADWHEREIYDMMGIQFPGHPNCTRILMWEGYPYFPLRKDFPLAGKPSDMPDVAFSGQAPLAGGPFIASSGGDTVSREPRAK